MIIPVAAAIIYKEEQILIARRAPGKSQAGFWEFPGGKIEKDETPEACLIRELQEELGIDVSVDQFVMENTYQYPNITILLKAYHCTFLSGQLELKDHDEVCWVDSAQLKRYNFAPADIPFVTYLTR